jgi:ribonuclease BN (tRNA processing enzyme)
VAYLTDNELGPGGAGRVPAEWRDTIVQFVRGAALLIHDGMYTADVGKARAGWGHSTATEAVALAASGGVSQLALFHHDPEHDDSQLDGLLAVARVAAPAGLTVDAARDGWTVTL